MEAMVIKACLLLGGPLVTQKLALGCLRFDQVRSINLVGTHA